MGNKKSEYLHINMNKVIFGLEKKKMKETWTYIKLEVEEKVIFGLEKKKMKEKKFYLLDCN